MLEIKNVSVNRNSKEVLNIENFKFDFSKSYNIYGGTGEGKTTLLEVLVGVEKPASGDVLIDDLSLYDSGFMELSFLRKKLGVMFDLPGLISNQSLYENIKLAVNSKGMIFDRSLRDVISQEYFESFKLENSLDARPGSLSVDQKRVVSFVRAIIAGPSFLVFDSFCDFLSGSFEKEIILFLRSLKEKGVGGIFLTKKRDPVGMGFDHYIELKRGSLYEP